jgi:hypothetical protein
MSKYMVGYCWTCAKRTKQRTLECKDSALFRAFEAVVTCGFGLLLDHDYECECTVCGEINTITKG